MKNIVICGGHLTPALAVIEQLEKSPGNWKINFLGRSPEYLTISGRGIPFYPIITAKFQRFFSLISVLSLINLPIGFIQSIIYLIKIKPALVLSFGGYVAFPVAVTGWLLGVPVVTHEQTTVFGLTNRIIARFSRVICISYKTTKFIPSGKKVVLTGNPVRQTIIYPTNTGITDFGNKKLPLIYITGGSQGSRSINLIIKDALNQLLTFARVLHQCGRNNNEKENHSITNISNYKLLPYINPDLIGEILQNADLVISRSGANTVAELEIWQVPTILIPLPWAADQEQEENAGLLTSKGFAKIIHQDNLSENLLITEVKKMLKMKKTKRNYINSDYASAAKKIVSVLNT